MFIISRNLNECIIIGGQIEGRIIVKILKIDRNTVKIGIQAPTHVPVHRQEIYDAIQRSNQAALNAGTDTIPKSPVASVTPPATTKGDSSSAPASSVEPNPAETP